jgi:hypothetical protein
LHTRYEVFGRDHLGESNVTGTAKLLGASVAAAILLSGASGFAQDATKKPGKAKSACNAITEETACKANTSCRWIAAIMDQKTGKQKRKAYCRTQGTSAKKSTPAK